jgi:hypothetical protein
MRESSHKVAVILQAVFFIACLTTLHAQAAGEELIARVRSFDESIRPEVAVSGTVIVGVAAASALNGAALDVTQVSLPDKLDSGELCLSVVSRDGIYYSRSVYDLPEGAAGRAVRLPYKKGPAGEMPRSYADTELAFAARLGACEDGRDEYLIVTAPDGDSDQSVRVYVNSFGATDVFLSASDGAPLGDCRYIDEGRRTTFDFWCDIPADAVRKLPAAFVIERERFGREQPSAAVTLLGTTER